MSCLPSYNTRTNYKLGSIVDCEGNSLVECMNPELSPTAKLCDMRPN